MSLLYFGKMGVAIKEFPPKSKQFSINQIWCFKPTNSDIHIFLLPPPYHFSLSMCSISPVGWTSVMRYICVKETM